MQEQPAVKKTASAKKNQYYEEAQLAVGQCLNRKVKVEGTRKKGLLTIEFYGEDDLKNLLSDLKLQEPLPEEQDLANSF